MFDSFCDRRELLALNWLFLSLNQLTSLDGELPDRGMENLMLVTVAHNRLLRLPDVLRLCPRLETMLASNNSIVSLNGVFARARRLQFLELDHNRLKAVSGIALSTRLHAVKSTMDVAIASRGREAV